MRAVSASAAAGAPLFVRLAPDIDRLLFEWRRQSSRTTVARAQSACHALRGEIVRGNGVDGFRPAAIVERPVDGGSGALGRITTSPALACDAPADLGSRPAFRSPGAESSDPAARRFL